VLFAASGILTYQLYVWGEQGSHAHNIVTDTWYELRTGLPFGILSATLFVRPLKRFPWIAFLDCFAWFAAYYTAIALWSRIGSYGSMAVAGFVGALAVAFFTGLARRELWTRRSLFQIALVGGAAGMPFAIAPSSTPNLNVLTWTFPLWQIAVGAWLYANTTSGLQKKPRE
jgi:hypothetical protein